MEEQENVNVQSYSTEPAPKKPAATVAQEPAVDVMPASGLFKGRMSRKNYLILWAASIVVGIAVSAFTMEGSATGFIIYGLVMVAMFFYSLSWSIRRLHDLNRSGWWILLELIPIVNFFIAIYILAWPSKNEGNEYGGADTGFSAKRVFLG